MLNIIAQLLALMMIKYLKQMKKCEGNTKFHRRPSLKKNLRNLKWACLLEKLTGVQTRSVWSKKKTTNKVGAILLLLHQVKLCSSEPGAGLASWVTRVYFSRWLADRATAAGGGGSAVRASVRKSAGRRSGRTNSSWRIGNRNKTRDSIKSLW